MHAGREGEMARFLVTITLAFVPAVAAFWISDVPWVAFLALLVTAPVVSIAAFRQVEAAKVAHARRASEGRTT